MPALHTGIIPVIIPVEHPSSVEPALVQPGQTWSDIVPTRISILILNNSLLRYRSASYIGFGCPCCKERSHAGLGNERLGASMMPLDARTYFSLP